VANKEQRKAAGCQEPTQKHTGHWRSRATSNPIHAGCKKERPDEPAENHTCEPVELEESPSEFQNFRVARFLDGDAHCSFSSRSAGGAFRLIRGTETLFSLQQLA
jgi:hypothetical protein